MIVNFYYIYILNYILKKLLKKKKKILLIDIYKLYLNFISY